MKNKIILAALIFVFVISFVYFLRFSQKDMSVGDNSSGSDTQESEPLNSERNIPLTTAESTQKDIVTNIELSKHSKVSDCWVGYEGKVYDITTFLPDHPGSAGKIAPFCGTSEEFTTAFENQHGRSKVSTLMRVGVFIGDFDVVGRI